MFFPPFCLVVLLWEPSPVSHTIKRLSLYFLLFFSAAITFVFFVFFVFFLSSGGWGKTPHFHVFSYASCVDFTFGYIVAALARLQSPLLNPKRFLGVVSLFRARCGSLPKSLFFGAL